MIFSLCWPTCSCSMLLFSVQFVNMLGAGRLGTESLAAISLANSYYNIVIYFLFGAASAIDTTVSQAFGRGKPSECRTWLWRSLIVFGVASVPFCGILLLSKPLFIGVGIAESVAEPASLYILRTLPGTPFLVFFVCLQKYQQAMNLMWPSVAVLVFSNVVNAVLTWKAVLAGSVVELAWALTYVRVLLCLLMAVAVYLTPQLHDETDRARSPLWTWQILKYFLGMCVSGAFMQGLEALAFELTVFAAATQGQVALDAHNLLLQVIALSYLSLPLGISIAATIRVGNLLGAGDADRARLCAHLCIGIGSFVMVMNGSLLFTFRRVVGTIFTSSPPVLDLIARIAPIAACFQSVDGFQGVCAGVLRAMGKQSFLAVNIFVAFYLVSTPIGFYLCFVAHWGVAGLWYGLSIGLGICAVGFGLTIFMLTDWRLEASIARSLSTPKDFSESLLVA